MGGAHDGDPTLGRLPPMITNAGAGLPARARRANAARPDVSITDLLKLVNAICWPSNRKPRARPRRTGCSLSR
jgi:hypothetical protein